MTELEEFTAGLLAQWRADGTPNSALTVGSLIDRIFPYRLARRELGIDVSEDYEALVLRLVAEEEGLIATAPAEAAEMARKTLASKLPDLDVLRVLRSATLTPAEETVSRLFDARPPRPKAAPTTREPEPITERVSAPAAVPEPDLPPPPPQPVPVPMPSNAADQCWSCQEAYPGGRTIKFCPFCGADQRRPVCGQCRTEVERHWKHCPECGARLWERETTG